MPRANPGRSWPRAALRGLAASCFALGMALGAARHAAAAPVPGAEDAPRPALAASASDAAEAAEAEARVALGPGGRDIRLAGDLTEGVAARVEALLAAHPEVGRLHLTSDGGLVEEALALGDLVAARGLATYVPDACASACTLVFVRGRERYLATGGRLGFHAPYEAGPSGAAAAVDPAPERAAYLAAGVAPDFADEALAVPSDALWIPDAARLRAAGLVTAVVGTDRFPDSTLDADPSPAAARAQVLRTLPALAGADDALDALARWYRDGYLAGRPEAEAVAGLRRQASAHLRLRLREADDGTVRALGRAAVAALGGAGTGEGTCAAVVDGDLVALDEALRAARPEAPGLAAFLAPSGAGGTAAPGAAAAAGPAPDGPGRCDRLRAAVRRALDRPLPEIAAALRALLARDPASEVASAALP